MDINTLMASMTQAAKTIFEMFSIKVILAAVLALMLDKHFLLFAGFVALVFVDCFTKWMALSYQYLQEQGVAAPSVWQAIKGIRAARRAGKINSTTMKERGLGKIAVYVICAFAAGTGDLMMRLLHMPMWMVHLVIGYMVATEVLSVVENLSDAGMSELEKLVDKLKGRL